MDTIGTPLTALLKQLAAETGGGAGDAVGKALLGLERSAARIARTLAVMDLEGGSGARKTGEVNVQGEEQKGLDVVSNDIVCEEAERAGGVAVLVSEELEAPLTFKVVGDGPRLSLRVDPLDGSSNLGVNVTVGTIFSLVPVPDGADPTSSEALLLPGTAQACAGYVAYGPATVLVVAAGQGPVRSFTLDPASGQFRLSAGSLRMPAHKAIYSTNEAYTGKWTPEVRALVDGWRTGSEPGGPWSARYVGSLVADFHRTLLHGGIYFYPGEAKKPEGKLRLLYEAQPMAWIAAHAGGRASNGRTPILSLVPTRIHERTPLLIGSDDTVKQAEERLARG